MALAEVREVGEVVLLRYRLAGAVGASPSAGGGTGAPGEGRAGSGAGAPGEGRAGGG